MMRHFRRLASDAQMRAGTVVEGDEITDKLPCLPISGELWLPIQTFRLYDAVGTLGNGVVCGIVVLRHGYGHVMLLQQFHVIVTAVLDAAVGVVDQTCHTCTCTGGLCLGQGHLQGFYGVYGLQTVGERPTHDLAGIGIRNQVEVGYVTAGKGYVGDVGHPDPVGRGRHKAFYTVLPLVVAVVGVCSASGLGFCKHEPLAAQSPEETVATGNTFPAEQVSQHQPQLVAAQTGIMFPDLTDGRNKTALIDGVTLYVCL